MNDFSLDKFDPKKSELVQMAKDSEGLVITDLNNKDQYATVHQAEQKLVKARTSINKIRKEYTRQFDETKKRVMDVEKELLAIIEPEEQRLKAEKQKVKDEEDRIIRESEEKEKKRIKDRIDKLMAVEFFMNDEVMISGMSDEYFDNLLAEKTEQFSIRKKEREEQDKKQADLEAREAELKKKEDKIKEEDERKKRDQEIEDAKKKAVQDEKDRQIKEQQLEQIRKADERIKLEADKKYQEFLDAHEGQYSRIAETPDGKRVALWKLVAEFTKS